MWRTWTVIYEYWKHHPNVAKSKTRGYMVDVICDVIATLIGVCLENGETYI